MAVETLTVKSPGLTTVLAVLAWRTVSAATLYAVRDNLKLNFKR